MSTDFQTENISAFLDGEMSEEQARAFLAEIERHPEAAAELRKMLQLRELIADACKFDPAAAQLPPAAQARWQAAVRREAAQRPAAAAAAGVGTAPAAVLRPRHGFWRAAVPMAATVLIAAGVLWYVRRGPQQGTEMSAAPMQAPHANAAVVALNETPPTPPAAPSADSAQPAEQDGVNRFKVQDAREDDGESGPAPTGGLAMDAAPPTPVKPPTVSRPEGALTGAVGLAGETKATADADALGEAPFAGATAMAPAPGSVAPKKPPLEPAATPPSMPSTPLPSARLEAKTSPDTAPTAPAEAAPPPAAPSTNQPMVQWTEAEPPPRSPATAGVAAPRPAPPEEMLVDQTTAEPHGADAPPTAMADSARPPAAALGGPVAELQPAPAVAVPPPAASDLTTTAADDAGAAETHVAEATVEPATSVLHIPYNDQNVVLIRRWVEARGGSLQIATDNPGEPLQGPAFLGLVGAFSGENPEAPVLKVILPARETAALRAYVSGLPPAKALENVTIEPAQPADMAPAATMEMAPIPSQNDTPTR